eukprot:CAMPEP_0119423638 /NCGR_PEP_ID=MMETSP1335-20130426/30778_1 /TAXON_ID=259385 /ORGANISM="Chrysoculter rhomboideus, Strain RCC1486" /LENGTH=250 /DNA_ID=CAMNT_0007449131 /DNA_START=36 /DNA_END=788 /DNA_ORIENTATION=+
MAVHLPAPRPGPRAPARNVRVMLSGTSFSRKEDWALEDAVGRNTIQARAGAGEREKPAVLWGRVREDPSLCTYDVDVLQQRFAQLHPDQYATFQESRVLDDWERLSVDNQQDGTVLRGRVLGTGDVILVPSTGPDHEGAGYVEYLGTVYELGAPRSRVLASNDHASDPQAGAKALVRRLLPLLAVLLALRLLWGALVPSGSESSFYYYESSSYYSRSVGPDGSVVEERKSSAFSSGNPRVAASNVRDEIR